MSYLPPVPPVVSTLNSTSVALGGGLSFTGTAEDVLLYQSVSIALSVTGANASGTLYVEFSIDGATWPTGLSNSAAISANSAVRHNQIVLARYFRVRYVNGATAQATFAIQTVLDGPKIALDTSHPNETVTDNTDAIVTRSILMGQHASGIYEQVPVEPGNALSVAVTWPLSAFSEMLVVQPTPHAQIDGSSLALPSAQTASWLASGAGASVGLSGNRFALQCGTASTGIAYLQSRETLRYRTGQGNAARFTTVFDATPRAQNYQLVGPISPENGFAVGYNETTFGFLRRTGGLREIRTFTITAATTAGDTMTVTLDGVATVLPVSTAAAAASPSATAYFISQQSFSANGRGWQAYASGATVIFVAGWAAPLAGAFTITGGTVTYTVATTVVGVAPTDNWTPKTEWNVDRLDGSRNAFNPSGQTLAPTFGNVWQISYQWLGYGAIVLGAEDAATGRLIPCHVVRYNNTAATTSVANPNLPIRIESSNFGNTNNVTVLSPSLETFTQGTPRFTGARFSTSDFNAAVGATLTPLFSIRIRPVLGGRLNLTQIVLATLTASSQGTNVGRVVIIYNGVLATLPAWNAVNADSMVDVDVASTTISGGTEIQQLSLGGSSSVVLDMTSFDFTLAYGDVLTVACQSRAGNVDYNASLSWFEDR